MTHVDVVQALRAARSVAIVGASDDGAKASGRTQRYLRRYGFSGAVHPVNPRRATVQGAPSYPSIADLPETPDLAVVVVAAEHVESAIVELGRIGTPLAVVFASGYAEVEGGASRQDSLRAVAAAAGVRVIGPNCVGAVMAPALTAAFMSGLDQDRFDLADDGVAFVSQSGAMGAFILNLAQGDGIGVGTFVSTGNEMDVTVSELIADLAHDPSTRVILGYVEGIRDGAAFVDALATAQARGVPVCLMKVGRSARGAAAAASHTGSLAGSDRVYEGVFARHGVHRAESVQDLLDLARVLALSPRPAGRRVTIVTLSGGAGALMTDEAERLGLDVFTWDDTWRRTMGEGLPTFASTTNPIDTTGVIAISDEALAHAVEVALANPQTDVAVLVLGNLDGEEDRVCRVIAASAATSSKPLVVTWVGGSGRAPTMLTAAGIPCFPDPRRTMQAVAALCRGPVPPPSERAEDAPGEDVVLPSRLDEVSVKRVLAEIGVPGVEERAVSDGAEAVAAADAIGYPVVAKLLSEDVLHKSELGAVKVGLTDADQLRDAVADILDVADREALTDRRVVVQAMASAGPELILGGSVDPVFGPVVLVGTGGIFAEIAEDVAVRPAPVSSREAAEMVDSLSHVALLRGARGGRVVDEAELARTIARFSAWFARATDLESVEVNPLAFTADGSPVALDALAVRRTDREPS